MITRILLLVLVGTATAHLSRPAPEDSEHIHRHRRSVRSEEDGRLPRDLVPYHYDIDVTPDFYQASPPFAFTGTVTISFDVSTPTSSVTLNVDGQTITSVTTGLSPDSPDQPLPPSVLSWEVKPAAQFLVITVLGTYMPGAKYYVTVQYLGNMNSFGSGLYYDSYVSSVDGSTNYIVATQFEAIGARHMFPSFDEPDLKATFTVTVAYRSPFTALSNMPVERTDTRPNGWFANVYERSPIMSTYQVCIAVGLLSYIEADWVGVTSFPIRVYGRPDLLNQFAWAANASAAIHAWLERETGISYNLPKMDHIALPSKGGAMENWGLITYGEQSFAVNPQTSPASGIQLVGLILSHELAHQWYGNLVTAKWWDDIWLNEGFASHYDFPPTQTLGWPAFEPTRRDTQDFFDADQKNTSDPVRKNIDTVWKSEEIAFSGSTYPKGSAMVTQLRAILGETTFHSGLTSYLNEFSYGSATADDLWRKLTEQATADGHPTDVKTIMDPWLNQMGFPLLTVTRSAGGLATVTQTQFLSPPGQEMNTPSEWNYKWTVPLTVVTANSDPSDWNGMPTDWFDIGANSLELTGLPNNLNQWVIVNPNQRYYYRVKYDDVNHLALAEQLTLDHEVIPVESRGALVDDYFAIARGSYGPETDAMDFTVYLGEETSYNPWYAALKYTSLSNQMFSGLPLYSNFVAYMLKILTPAYNTVGWDTKPNETPDDQLLRTDIIDAACGYNLADCRQTARTKFNTYMANPDVNSIDPNVLATVLCTGVADGAGNEFATAYLQYLARRSSQIVEERRAYLRAMSCTRDDQLLDIYFAYIVQGENIASRDAYRATLYLSQNPDGPDKIWTYFDNSWGAVPSSMNKMLILRRITSTFSTTARLNQWNAFQAKHPPTDSERSAFLEITLTIEQNIRWLGDNQSSLTTWLSAHLPLGTPRATGPIQPMEPFGNRNSRLEGRNY